MSEENFANVPLSLNELRANKTQKASNWTPRDCLIDLLRRIDKGELVIENLICSFETPDDYQFSNACMSNEKAIYLLANTQHKLLTPKG